MILKLTSTSPSKTFAGNEEIVLKKQMGQKSGRRAPKGATAADGSTSEAKNVYAQRSSGIILPEYRLPTEAEWEYAALALVGNREYNHLQRSKEIPLERTIHTFWKKTI